MKKALFLLAFLPILICSCFRKEEKEKGLSSGKINTIAVIIDEQLWSGEVGDSIRNKFASTVIGLPKEEPLFTINQYPIKLLEGFRTNSRNIIIVKKESKTLFNVVEDEFTKPQNVYHISAKTAAGILGIIEANAPSMIKKMKQSEIRENQRINDTALFNSESISRKFKIGIKIPASYSVALQKRHFIWLKKEIISGNLSILIYQIPISALKNQQSVTNNIIRIRDSVGKRYIRGTAPDTPMVTEDSYAPYLFKIRFRGKETFQTKGTWELKNDYMSGPFNNYCIVDRAKNRILVLEGFCYAPSKEKRDLMFELESIIKSVTFLQKTKSK